MLKYILSDLGFHHITNDYSECSLLGTTSSLDYVENKWGPFDIPTVRYSDSSIFRQFDIPTVDFDYVIVHSLGKYIYKTRDACT